MLEASVARRWVLAELAEELHLAPGYLVRLFKAATGLPPMAYLAQVRAEYAAVMLLHSDEPVTCIGRAVGWPDQNYFARRFKAHYGLTPRHTASASPLRRRIYTTQATTAAVGRGAVPGRAAVALVQACSALRRASG